MENLNDAQYEALTQLRKSVSDVLLPKFTDTWLIKWLRAHNYNVKKTERLLRGHLACWHLYEIDSFVDNYEKKEVTLKYEYTWSLGIDKNGSPIRYTRVGAGDHIGFLMSLCGYEVVLYCTYLTELDLSILRKENERTGRDVNEVTYILDMDQFSISQIMHQSILEMAMDLVQMIQDQYPEIWGNIFVINVPSYFDKIFNLFKPIIRHNMIDKIRLASRESTPHLLLKYIDEDTLPEFLGGKRVDSLCSEMMKPDNKVPEEFFVCNRIPPLQLTWQGVDSVWVSARSFFNHSVVILHAPSKIHVEFRSENGSIGLKMLFRDLDPISENPDLPSSDEFLDEKEPRCNVKFVSPPCRMQSHTTPVDVIVNAPWKGIYIFRFDNTHSWFTSRKIIFRIREKMDKEGYIS